MRIRVKFAKRTPLQYLGHLDVMRFFQKAIRRADLPVRFSEGYSPHILLSFASPLGVGKRSEGEYFDLELQKDCSAEEVVCRLQSQMPEGFAILGASAIEEGKKNNGMRQIAAASYHVALPRYSAEEIAPLVHAYLAQASIPVLHRTKKREEWIDLCDGLYSLDCVSSSEEKEGGCALIFLVSAGSRRNIRPELVLQSFWRFAGLAGEPDALPICRCDLFANRGSEEVPRFVSLLDCDVLPKETG